MGVTGPELHGDEDEACAATLIMVVIVSSANDEKTSKGKHEISLLLVEISHLLDEISREIMVFFYSEI